MTSHHVSSFSHNVYPKPQKKYPLFSFSIHFIRTHTADGSQASARSGLREVDAVYEYIAQMLFISPEQAKGINTSF